MLYSNCVILEKSLSFSESQFSLMKRHFTNIFIKLNIAHMSTSINFEGLQECKPLYLLDKTFRGLLSSEGDRQGIGSFRTVWQVPQQMFTQTVHRYTQEELLKVCGGIGTDYSKCRMNMVGWCFRKCGQGACVGWVWWKTREKSRP